jgi:hypothetical protein
MFYTTNLVGLRVRVLAMAVGTMDRYAPLPT